MRDSKKKKTLEIKNIFRPELENKYQNFNVKFLKEDKTDFYKIKFPKKSYIKIMKLLKKLPMQYQNYVLLFTESSHEEKIDGGVISVNDMKKYDKIFKKEDVFSITIINEDNEENEAEPIPIETSSIDRIMELMNTTSENMLTIIDLMIISEQTEYYERKLRRSKTKNVDRNINLKLYLDLYEHAKKFRKGNLSLVSYIFDNVDAAYEKKIEEEKKFDEENDNLKKLNEEMERLKKENEVLLKKQIEKKKSIHQGIIEKEEIEKELNEVKKNLDKEKEFYNKKIEDSKILYEKQLKENEEQQKKMKEIENQYNNEENKFNIKKRKITEEYEIEIKEHQNRIMLKKEQLENAQKTFRSKLKRLSSKQIEQNKNNELSKQLEQQMEELEKEKEENEKLKEELAQIRKLKKESLSIQKEDLTLLKIPKSNLSIEKLEYKYNSIIPKIPKLPINKKINPFEAPEVGIDEEKIIKDEKPEIEEKSNSKKPNKPQKQNKQNKPNILLRARANKRNKNKEIKLPESKNEEGYISDSYIPAETPRESGIKKKMRFQKKKSNYPEEFERELNINKPQRRLSYTSDHVILYPFSIEVTDDMDDGDYYVTGNIDSLGNWDHNRAFKLSRNVINGKIFYTGSFPIRQNQFPFEYKFFVRKDNNNKWVGKPYINYKTSNEIFNYLLGDKSKVLGVLNVNVRYLNNTDGNNVWYNRKERMVEIIYKSNADVIFFQEMTRKQYDDISHIIDSIFTSVGIYRDKSDSSEKISIAFNKNKFTLCNWGQFWLSSTPNIPGSNDFNNFFPRICTWCFLEKIDFHYNYLFFNVHLDHVNMDAHLPSVRVLLNEMRKIIKKYHDNVIIFLGGCFYCDENDPIIQLIKDFGFTLIHNDNTYHEFTGKAFKRWDYMFYINPKGKVTLNQVKIFSEESVINKNKGIYVSDHFPLYSEFEIA